MRRRSHSESLLDSVHLRRVLLGLSLILTWSQSRVEAHAAASSYDAYYGNYREGKEHFWGVSPFVMDSGETVVLLSDYSSGVVRRLFPVSDSEFVMGPGFNVASPVELKILFATDERGRAIGITLQRADGSVTSADRVALRQEEVSFQVNEARLSGSLIMPGTRGPHPAIVLLHGSGPLTRYSFGPYPHFFTSLGFAVLIYDKRGTGASTGTRLDASVGAVMMPGFYPDDLADDAVAALQLLERRDDIDPEQIGLWGSSEGGMLSMYVAARSKNVAFAINSSGFMGPLWQTLRYQSEIVLRNAGVSEAALTKEMKLIDLWFQVGRTGQGWKDFEMLRDEIVEADGSWFYQSMGDTYPQTRWVWRHILSFDPLSALKEVTCPVLAVFGELDPLTNAENASENMTRALSAAGHKDFTVKIFPNAGHSLALMPTKDRMAPGVFETLRSWLLERVNPASNALAVEPAVQ